MMNNMKCFAKYLFAACAIGAFASCEDMLSPDSDMQSFEPSLNAKTDSLFYTFGILQGMQSVADQQVFLGEMRGDLVATTQYTDSMLTQLADFSATTTNRYDSAYLYYNIINNCNYYIEHRNTNLYNGATNVVLPEYAGVKAIRAWAYLQLVRNYRKVPFVTTPLTKISQIDDETYPEVDIAGLVSALAPDLEQYSGVITSNYGGAAIDVGSPNSSSATKQVRVDKLLIPVDIILGELYLENNQYSEAATHYIKYLTDVCSSYAARRSAFFSPYRPSNDNLLDAYPADWDNSNNTNVQGTSSWYSIFTSANSIYDVITYIPMAVNRTKGEVTSLPKAFGYNYYATEATADLNGGLYTDEIQIVPSQNYFAISDSTDFYYYPIVTGVAKSKVNQARLGDMRAYVGRLVNNRASGNSVLLRGVGEDSLKVWCRKYENANIYLYRTSTVLLHLAEAFNRLGMPDAAFAILKEGITSTLLTADADYYMSEATRTALQTTYPILSLQNATKFDGDTYPATEGRYGIHMHGAGMTRDFNGSNFVASPYRLDTIVGLKLRDLAADFPQYTIGTTKQDSINAMEDILCDEYAMEFAFEGTRYYDLMRLARHKNAAGLYSATYGNEWFAKKLAVRKPTKDLTDQQNWYLPFK